MQPGSLDRMWSLGRTSLEARLARLRSKGWQIAQCALAAGAAWLIAADLFGHDTPFFAPIAAVVSLGTSYGQRLRRVIEVTLEVAIGVFVGDLIVVLLGSGWWRLTLIVALAMSAAFLLDGGQLFVTQAAVQSIVVSTLLPDGRGADPLDRRADRRRDRPGRRHRGARRPLRRPREQASVVMRKISGLLRAAGGVMVDGQVERALALLADARSTDHLIQELQSAADEGLSVVASSPFRVRHKGNLRRMVDLVDPLDRALRHPRAGPADRRGGLPRANRAEVLLAARLRPGRRRRRGGRPAGGGRHGGRGPARAARRRCRDRTGRADRRAHRGGDPGAARSVVVDLLMLTGLDQIESTDALPPPPR